MRHFTNTGCSISWQTWVGMTYIRDVPQSCPLALPILPKSHLPQQNQEDSGTAKIKVNPAKVRELMEHPVVTE